MLEVSDARYPIQGLTATRDRLDNGAAEKTQQPDDWPSAHSRFHYGPELPDINEEKFSFVFDYSNDVSKYFVLYGEQVILSGPAEHDVKRSVKDIALRQQFIQIARKLKTRYGGAVGRSSRNEESRIPATPIVSVDRSNARGVGFLHTQ
jgi:hypothetical protein